MRGLGTLFPKIPLSSTLRNGAGELSEEVSRAGYPASALCWVRGPEGTSLPWTTDVTQALPGSLSRKCNQGSKSNPMGLQQPGVLAKKGLPRLLPLLPAPGSLSEICDLPA